MYNKHQLYTVVGDRTSYSLYSLALILLLSCSSLKDKSDYSLFEERDFSTTEKDYYLPVDYYLSDPQDTRDSIYEECIMLSRDQRDRSKKNTLPRIIDTCNNK